MSESNRPMGSLSEDERRLIRLFRCLNGRGQSETLQVVGKRLLIEAAVDTALYHDESEEQTIKDQLDVGIDDCLNQIRPVDCELLDLRDSDFDVTEEGWQKASISVAEVILGSDSNDDEFAQMLVDAYVEGVRKCGLTLPIDFLDADDNEEEAVQSLRKDLQGKALSFIKNWRERLLRRFEQNL